MIAQEICVEQPVAGLAMPEESLSPRFELVDVFRSSPVRLFVWFIINIIVLGGVKNKINRNVFPARRPVDILPK